jgi:hypothetical protein
VSQQLGVGAAGFLQGVGQTCEAGRVDMTGGE